MLEVKDLSVRYGSVEALHDVSIKVETGGLVAILGANGAGKSTLLRTISGIVKAASGNVALDGTAITGLRPEEIVRRGIAHVPEGRGILPDFTVRENLMIGAYVRRGQDVSPDYRRVMGMFPAIERRERKLGYTLSGGEQQMLAIGRALMAAPQVLLADELSLGLAPIIVRQVFATLDQVRRTGVTVLVVEQNARLAMKFADYLYVLKYGRVVMEGPRETFAKSTDLVDAYLGA
ncbi:ABC transporter ATP-binding protein [Reyranella soli]|jgi:branched-chain amino acid transport system ATP-binding protein|uniref:ABC transporter ATP-binding protein n=1 Tax=Reyranella soli TaxID=1230389 RepID=A0A512N992_9HYPH|nr:ABC transporter ATP-binding protein [Reyranella soli]GEP55550.1 ABC transporter ATP-binding protein [Reyranella soli]